MLLPLQFKEWRQLSAYKLNSLKKKKKKTLVSEPLALCFPQQAPAALRSAQQTIKHVGSNVMTHVACLLLPITLITSFCNILFVKTEQ